MVAVRQHSLQRLPVSPSVDDCEGQNTWCHHDVLRTALKASQALGVVSGVVIQVCKISLNTSVNSRKTISQNSMQGYAQVSHRRQNQMLIYHQKGAYSHP